MAASQVTAQEISFHVWNSQNSADLRERGVDFTSSRVGFNAGWSAARAMLLATIKERYEIVSRGDKGSLLELLLADLEPAAPQQEVRDDS